MEFIIETIKPAFRINLYTELLEGIVGEGSEKYYNPPCINRIFEITKDQFLTIVYLSLRHPCVVSSRLHNNRSFLVNGVPCKSLAKWLLSLRIQLLRWHWDNFNDSPTSQGLFQMLLPRAPVTNYGVAPLGIHQQSLRYLLHRPFLPLFPHRLPHNDRRNNTAFRLGRMH